MEPSHEFKLFFPTPEKMDHATRDRAIRDAVTDALGLSPTWTRLETEIARGADYQTTFVEAVQACVKLALGPDRFDERIQRSAARVKDVAVRENISLARAFIFYRACIIRNEYLSDLIQERLGIADDDLFAEQSELHTKMLAGDMVAAPRDLRDDILSIP